MHPCALPGWGEGQGLVVLGIVAGSRLGIALSRVVACPCAEVSLRAEGGGWVPWNPKVQKFVYQKQPKSRFPFVKFHVFP